MESLLRCLEALEKEESFAVLSARGRGETETEAVDEEEEGGKAGETEGKEERQGRKDVAEWTPSYGLDVEEEDYWDDESSYFAGYDDGDGVCIASERHAAMKERLTTDVETARVLKDFAMRCAAETVVSDAEEGAEWENAQVIADSALLPMVRSYVLGPPTETHVVRHAKVYLALVRAVLAVAKAAISRRGAVSTLFGPERQLLEHQTCGTTLRAGMDGLRQCLQILVRAEEEQDEEATHTDVTNNNVKPVAAASGGVAGGTGTAEEGQAVPAGGVKGLMASLSNSLVQRKKNLKKADRRPAPTAAASPHVTGEPGAAAALVQEMNRIVPFLPAVEEVVPEAEDGGDDDGGEQARLEARYVELVSEQLVESADLTMSAPNGGYLHHYASSIEDDTGTHRERQRRVMRELRSLEGFLPVHFNSVAMLRFDEERPFVMKFVIAAPDNTPYDSGIFLFDLYCASSYPNQAPSVNLMTTGQGSVGFGPNLYADGKVCLSLLGTWAGPPESRWNPDSTVGQVILSIQAMILNAQFPYFLEPGFEASWGSEHGMEEARISQNGGYEMLRVATIKHAMTENIHNPPAGFESFTKTHFWLKKWAILRTIDGWIEDAWSSDTSWHLGQLLEAKRDFLDALLQLGRPFLGRSAVSGETQEAKTAEDSGDNTDEKEGEDEWSPQTALPGESFDDVMLQLWQEHNKAADTAARMTTELISRATRKKRLYDLRDGLMFLRMVEVSAPGTTKVTRPRSVPFRSKAAALHSYRGSDACLLEDFYDTPPPKDLGSSTTADPYDAASAAAAADAADAAAAATAGYAISEASESYVTEDEEDTEVALEEESLTSSMHEVLEQIASGGDSIKLVLGKAPQAEQAAPASGSLAEWVAPPQPPPPADILRQIVELDLKANLKPTLPVVKNIVDFLLPGSEQPIHPIVDMLEDAEFPTVKDLDHVPPPLEPVLGSTSESTASVSSTSVSTTDRTGNLSASPLGQDAKEPESDKPHSPSPTLAQPLAMSVAAPTDKTRLSGMSSLLAAIKNGVTLSKGTSDLSLLSDTSAGAVAGAAGAAGAGVPPPLPKQRLVLPPVRMAQKLKRCGAPKTFDLGALIKAGVPMDAIVNSLRAVSAVVHAARTHTAAAQDQASKAVWGVCRSGDDGTVLQLHSPPAECDLVLFSDLSMEDESVAADAKASCEHSACWETQLAELLCP